MRIINIQHTQNPDWIQITMFMGDNTGSLFEQKVTRLRKEEIAEIARHCADDTLPVTLTEK